MSRNGSAEPLQFANIISGVADPRKRLFSRSNKRCKKWVFSDGNVSGSKCRLLEACVIRRLCVRLAGSLLSLVIHSVTRQIGAVSFSPVKSGFSKLFRGEFYVFEGWCVMFSAFAKADAPRDPIVSFSMLVRWIVNTFYRFDAMYIWVCWFEDINRSKQMWSEKLKKIIFWLWKSRSHPLVTVHCNISSTENVGTCTYITKIKKLFVGVSEGNFAPFVAYALAKFLR